ncbi:hypothetical protein DFH09DRAFT_1093505 [Mycena vulgaris]|nr:hypothetical protein DFH09DRAFT_1093505 [Mycena vulgaris]
MRIWKSSGSAKGKCSGRVHGNLVHDNLLIVSVSYQWDEDCDTPMVKEDNSGEAVQITAAIGPDLLEETQDPYCKCQWISNGYSRRSKVVTSLGGASLSHSAPQEYVNAQLDEVEHPYHSAPQKYANAQLDDV